MRLTCLLVAAALFCLSCKREDAGGEAVELYLLKNSPTVPGKCQVDASLAQLEDNPAVSNEDIMAYAMSTHTFQLSDAAFRRVKAFSDRTAFAVTVDRRVIYYGFFKPSISSSSCGESITMDVLPDKNVVLRLGYPGVMTGVTIDDQRNNASLLATLNKQNKLRP